MKCVKHVFNICTTWSHVETWLELPAMDRRIPAAHIVRLRSVVVMSHEQYDRVCGWHVTLLLHRAYDNFAYTCEELSQLLIVDRPELLCKLVVNKHCSGATLSSSTKTSI